MEQAATNRDPSNRMPIGPKTADAEALVCAGLWRMRNIEKHREAWSDLVAKAAANLQTPGETEPITDAQAVSDAQIIALYHQRWGIETIHREMKGIAAGERWHGTTKLLIRQEIHAVMCWFAIAGAIANYVEADATADQRQVGDERPEKRVNTNLVFNAVHTVLAWQAAIGHQHEAVVDYLRSHAETALDMVRRFMQRRRLGRWHERKPKHP